MLVLGVQLSRGESTRLLDAVTLVVAQEQRMRLARTAL